MRRGVSLIIFCLTCLLFFPIKAEAVTTFEVSGRCAESPKATIYIRVDAPSKYAGFNIYRADDRGIYQYVDYVGIGDNMVPYSEEDYDYSKNEYESESVLEKKKYVEYRKYTFTDPTELVVYKTYSYKIVGYRYVNDIKTDGNTSYVSVTILPSGPTLTSGKRKGKLGAELNWTIVPGADGYVVYCAQNYDEESNYVHVDYDNIDNYELLETIGNGNTYSTTYDNLRNGVTYTFRVCSYKNINGNKMESVVSDMIPVTMDYYSYDGESNIQKTKRAFGSEKKKLKNFKTSAKAAKQMKTIKVKVWDFKNGKKGKKITRIMTITVNKNLAPSIQQMFLELYQSKEKQVIHDIGCYSYRTGQHMYGLAIDFNWNENYMIDNGKIIAGSFWKPGKNAYSIPNDSEFVRILARYGFARGAWGNRKDYMHFSYFGT